MPSTFFGLTIAGSALNTFHVATNTVANNISNVNTKGYSRQEAVRMLQKPLGPTSALAWWGLVSAPPRLYKGAISITM